MINLSIVIPCYNEQENLPILIQRIGEMKIYNDIEFVLVENGSDDGSKEIIQKAVASCSNLRMVEVEKNQGYGYGIKKGIESCKSSFIGWTHADLQVNLKDVLSAYLQLSNTNFEQNQFFKGIRKKENRTKTERFLTGAMGKILSLILGKKMNDINGQPNIYPFIFKDTILQAPNDVNIEIFCYHMALEMSLQENRYYVSFDKRQYGKSKLLPSFKSRVRTIYNTLRYAISLRKQSFG